MGNWKNTQQKTAFNSIGNVKDYLINLKSEYLRIILDESESYYAISPVCAIISTQLTKDQISSRIEALDSNTPFYIHRMGSEWTTKGMDSLAVWLESSGAARKYERQ